MHVVVMHPISDLWRRPCRAFLSVMLTRASCDALVHEQVAASGNQLEQLASNQSRKSGDEGRERETLIGGGGSDSG